MAKRRKKPDDSDHVARDGALVLTFVNTGSRRSRRLEDYTDLLAWANRYGVLPPAESRRLGELAAEHPEDAAAVFTDATELHALLSGIVNAAVDGQAPPAPAVDGLNALLVRITPRRILAAGQTRRLRWDWPEDPERVLFRPLWPVVVSALDLLTSDDAVKVRRCAAEDCDVLFLQRHAGMPRKWCAESCSAPVRSRRYHRRVVQPRRKRARSRDRSSSTD